MQSRHRLVVLALLALLAACGGQPAAVAPTARPVVSTPSAAVQQASAPPLSLSAPTAAGAATGATRTVVHAFGTAEVPLKPQRVVALDAFFTLTPLIELGVPVIGSVSLGAPAQYPGLSAEESASITSIGDGRLANLETVAALKPDLIIGVDFAEPPYDELSQIAPTVIIKTALDWKGQHRALGEATGTLDAAEQGIAAFEARAQALKARMPSVTASYLNLLGEQPAIYLLSDKAWAPLRVLDEAGVKRPADEIDAAGEFSKPISLELLPELKGDVLLYAEGYPGLDAESASKVSGVTATPIWQQIPAVKAGKAFEIDGACWETFGGLRSANGVLDDIERIFLTQ